MQLEPAIHAYHSVRAKRHGVGQGSRLRALKMALVMFALVNQRQRWLAKFAWWLAVHGTPLLPPSIQEISPMRPNIADAVLWVWVGMCLGASAVLILVEFHIVKAF